MEETSYLKCGMLFELGLAIIVYPSTSHDILITSSPSSSYRSLPFTKTEVWYAFWAWFGNYSLLHTSTSHDILITLSSSSYRSLPLNRSKHLLFLLLFVVVFVVAVCDFLRQLSEQVGRFDFADGVCELVSFTVHVLAVHTVAVACGQRRLCLCVHVSVLHCRLMGHLGQRGVETETNKHVNRYVKQNQVNRKNVGVYPVGSILVLILEKCNNTKSFVSTLFGTCNYT